MHLLPRGDVHGQIVMAFSSHKREGGNYHCVSELKGIGTAPDAADSH